MRQRQRRQNERQHHGCSLGRNHDMLAIAAVGHNPAQRGKQKYRNLAGKSHRAQLQPRAGQTVHQPGLSHGLHPCADQGNELPAEEKLEVSVPESPSRRLPPQPSPLRLRTGRHGALNGVFRFSHAVL